MFSRRLNLDPAAALLVTNNGIEFAWGVLWTDPHG